MSRDRERPAGIAPVSVPEAGSAGAFAPLEASILLATPCSSRSGPEPAVQPVLLQRLLKVIQLCEG